MKKHARWILTVDPEAGLEMFTEMQPPLPPDSVLPILASHAPSLCATYLETAIAQGSVSAQVSVITCLESWLNFCLSLCCLDLATHAPSLCATYLEIAVAQVWVSAQCCHLSQNINGNCCCLPYAWRLLQHKALPVHR